MSSLTALQQSERSELRYVNPIQLVHITLPSGLILYFSSLDYIYTFSSTTVYYDSYVQSIDGLGNVVELDNIYNPTISITLKNKPWGDYNYLINLRDDDEFTRADVAIYEVRPITLDETFSSDIRECLWKGNVKQIENISLETFELSCCSRLHNKKNAFNLNTITEDDFPNSHPPDRGKYRNKIYGSVDKVVTRNIVSGAMDKITLDMTEAQTTVYISGSNEIPFASSGSVQIDEEIISYTSVTTSGTRQTQLNGCTRGASSTTAAIHDKGAYVGQVLTQFIYEVADHPVKSIDRVFVDDIRQTSGYTAYTGQTGSQLTGYENTAVVRFTVLPKVGQQVNVDLTDHNHNTSQGSHAHASGGTLTSDSSRTASSVAGEYLVTNSIYAVDGSSSTAAIVANTSSINHGYLYLGKSSNASLGTLVSVTVGFRIATTGISSRTPFTLSYGSSSINITSNYAGATDVSFSFGSSSWTGNIGIAFSSLMFPKDPAQVFVYGINFITMYYSTSPTDYSPADGVDTTKLGVTSLSGGTSTSTIVIGNEVTADVQGYQDDGSGTYTGTASALITNPADVYKHLYRYQAGFSASDLDTTSFTAARSFYSTNSYNFAFVLHDIGTEADKICGDLAYQIRSSTYEWGGKFYLDVLPSSTPTSDMTIYDEDIIDYPSYSYTSLDDLVNKYRAFYLRKYTTSSESLDGVLNNDALAEGYLDVLISTTGNADLQGDLYLKAIRTSAAAQDILDFWLDYKSTIRLLLSDLKVRWKGIQLGPGDYFTYVDPIFGSKLFRITTFKPNRNSGVINISGEEYI